MVPTAIFAILALALLVGVDARRPQKIVAGNEVALGQYPYQASLKLNGNHRCSGTIISSRHIMTAAHCVMRPEGDLTVVTGTVSSTSGGETHRPSLVRWHYNYTDIRLSLFDIAVITLADDIVFTEFQNKIALATEPVPIGVMAAVTGWGSDSDLNIKVKTILNMVLLQTISEEQCQRMYDPDISIHPVELCTFNGPGFGVCHGDSGSPLVYNGTLYGIAAWVTPCSVGLPDVFTSIYHVLPWVNAIFEADSNRSLTN